MKGLDCMTNRYISENSELAAEYHFSDISLGLQIIAAAVVLKESPLGRKRSQPACPMHRCSAFWGSPQLALIAVSSPLWARLFSSYLDFASVPIGVWLDSSVLYLECTSHFCTSSLLLPVRSLVCGHSILPVSARFSAKLIFLLSCAESCLKPPFSHTRVLWQCDFEFSRI